MNTIAETRAIAVQYPRVGSSAQEAAATRGDAGKAADKTNAVVDTGAAAESRAPHAPGVLPMAPFIAQLIATQQALPQTRARNRATPAAAALAYRTAGRR